VRAIFYSRHHSDHCNGGTTQIVDRAAVEAGDVAIYAWDDFEAERRNEFGEILVRQTMGVAYYGGALLPAEDQDHYGIGLIPPGGASAYIAPPTPSHKTPSWSSRASA